MRFYCASCFLEHNPREAETLYQGTALCLRHMSALATGSRIQAPEDQE